MLLRNIFLISSKPLIFGAAAQFFTFSTEFSTSLCHPGQAGKMRNFHLLAMGRRFGGGGSSVCPLPYGERGTYAVFSGKSEFI